MMVIKDPLNNLKKSINDDEYTRLEKYIKKQISIEESFLSKVDLSDSFEINDDEVKMVTINVDMLLNLMQKQKVDITDETYCRFKSLRDCLSKAPVVLNHKNNYDDVKWMKYYFSGMLRESNNMLERLNWLRKYG